jgi:hypothetical protein
MTRGHLNAGCTVNENICTVTNLMLISYASIDDEYFVSENINIIPQNPLSQFLLYIFPVISH